jgi:hypothetical protein
MKSKTDFALYGGCHSLWQDLNNIPKNVSFHFSISSDGFL